MKKDALKSIIVLTSVCLVIALAMAAVYMVTNPIIKENNERAATEALYIVLDDATEFDKVSDYVLPSSVTAAYVDLGGTGYAFVCEVMGFGNDPIRLAVGVGNDGKIIKVYTIDCSSESQGYGSQVGEKWFTDSFIGVDYDGIINVDDSKVDTISGATISSSAYLRAVGDALTSYLIITGGARID